jgi:hypothetical protein
MRHLMAVAVILCTLSISGCAWSGGNVVDNSSKPEEGATMQVPATDIDGLLRLIQLTHQPQRVLWQTVALGSPESTALGPTDWGLVAAIEYDKDVIATIQLEIQPTVMRQDLQISPDFVQSWFPKGITESFVPVSGSSNLTLNQPHYGISTFARPPLQTGYTFIKDTWLFIYIQTT